MGGNNHPAKLQKGLGMMYKVRKKDFSQMRQLLNTPPGPCIRFLYPLQPRNHRFEVNYSIVCGFIKGNGKLYWVREEGYSDSGTCTALS